MKIVKNLKKVLENKINKFGIDTNMLLSQHFLINPKMVDLLVTRVLPDTIVFEIGPGLGQITEKLCQVSKKVVAIEIDKRFSELLIDLQKKYSNVKIEWVDALAFDWNKVIKNDKTQIISSLPYHITEPFLQKILKLDVDRIDLITGITLAKSVENIDKGIDINKTGLLIKTFYKWKVLAVINEEDFFPPPRTKSVLIELEKRDGKEMSVSDFLYKRLFLTSDTGILLKNFLRETLIIYSKGKLNKRKARQIVENLEIPVCVLNKSFSQINNMELSIFVKLVNNLEIGSILK